MADKEIVAKARLWVTGDGRVVEDGDPDAAFLLAPAGGMIDPGTAERYGISADGTPGKGKKAPEGAVVASTAAEAPAAEPAEGPAAEPPEEEKEEEHSASVTVKKAGKG